MLDWYVILAPLLLIPVVALLRFVGCGADSEFGDNIAYFGIAVNCGGPRDLDNVLYYRDDGQPDADTYPGENFRSVGGTPLKTNDPVLDGSGNPAAAVFGTCRTGADFRYDFSLKEGAYQIILRFAEIGEAQNPGDRVFSFEIENGGVTFGLPDGSNAAYDIVAKAGGPFRTRDEVIFITGFTTITTIRFHAGSGLHPEAMINAIEILIVETIILNPPAITLLAGQTFLFNATPPPGTPLTWEVTSPLGMPGTVVDGLYTAPLNFHPPIQETIVARTISEDTLHEVTGGAIATIYLPVDRTTKGSFRGIYGRDGFVLANTPTDGTPPSYVSQFTVSSFNGGPADIEVFPDGHAGEPQVLDPQVSRPAIMWDDINGVHGLSFSFFLQDSQPHVFSIYCLDFDTQGRKQRIEMVQLDSGITQTQDVLIGDGVYLVWIGSGHIRINVTTAPGSTGLNNVVNGIFFR